MRKNRAGILNALLAAALYGISSPIQKLLLAKIPPALMAALLYLGAGAGMSLLTFAIRRKSTPRGEAGLTRKELPHVAGMVLLDIAAPILLMAALTMTSAANVSLLNNFEIAATAVIALFLFKEEVGRRMWLAIALITLACMILSFEDAGSLSFSAGSALVLAACACWGFENNLTRRLSFTDPLRIVVIKGLGSGTGALAVALFLGQRGADAPYLLAAMLLGFVAYGLSIWLYIYAQRELGAARTSAYYAAAPFIGALVSFVIFGQRLTVSFAAALAVMAAGAYIAAGGSRRQARVMRK